MEAFVRRIALLGHPKDEASLEGSGVACLRAAFERLDIETKLFTKSEDMMGFAPDFVLALSLQQPKLTPFPTYGLINAPREGPVERLLEVRRFYRNICTYDAYATTSHAVKRMLGDIVFAARKRDSPVAFFGVTALMTPFRNAALDELVPLLGVSADDRRRFKPVCTALSMQPNLKLASNAAPDTDAVLRRLSLIGSGPQGDLTLFQRTGVGLCLDPANDTTGWINRTFFSLVAAGAIAIVPRSMLLEAIFGDCLLYLDPENGVEDIAAQCQEHVNWVRENPGLGAQKAARMHAIFCERLAIEALVPNLLNLHGFVLDRKGYKRLDSPRGSAALPSVTYIVRTGNRDSRMLERMLDSLVAQNYPGLHVLFVLWSPMPHLESIQRKYGNVLSIKVIEDYGGMRSTGICAGMKAIESELFGMIDDDDELHPNHVQTLVKCLRYHDGLDWRGKVGMVYSGSVDVFVTGSRAEKLEWQDHRYVDLREKRVIEHFRFYSATQMSQHRWFLMSNAWLAKTKLIDEEVLADPQLDTCEDLYVFLQLAQKTHMAFTGEVTAIHHYHKSGNSTEIDAHRHIADTSRIALRNYARAFPRDIYYHSAYMPVENWPWGEAKERRYGYVERSPKRSDYEPGPLVPTIAPFDDDFDLSYPRRRPREHTFASLAGSPQSLLGTIIRAYKRYLRMLPHERQQLRTRFTQIARAYGIAEAVRRTSRFGS
jgi:hypothetical protein